MGKVIDEPNPEYPPYAQCTQLVYSARYLGSGLQLAKAYKMGNGNSNAVTRAIDEFLNFYHFRPMLEHRHIQNIHLDAVYPRDGEDDTLRCFHDFANGKSLASEKDKVMTWQSTPTSTMGSSRLEPKGNESCSNKMQKEL